VPTPSKYSRHPLLTSLGAAIRAERKQRELSQEQLAALADMDRSYIGQIERGENSVGLIPLATIADILGISLSDLFDKAKL
jgi:transcriptional regulator with XRE-family HTH domain